MQQTTSTSYAKATPRSTGRSHGAGGFAQPRHLISLLARGAHRSSRTAHIMSALPPDQLHDIIQHVSGSMSLAYEAVVLPCHNMSCGDITYRRYG